MKTELLIATLAVSMLAPWCCCQEKSAAKPTYADLVAKVKAGDKSIDFRELRFAYADSRGGADTDKQKKAMTAALNSKKYDEAL